MLRQTDNDMPDAANDLDRALAAIRNADLQYPDEELLECFLQESTDPAATARYMLQRCSAGGDSVDLMPVLSDWKQLIASFTGEVPLYRRPSRGVVADIQERDGGKCCLTGLTSSLFDPLVVVPIFPITNPIPISLHDMLGVFIGPKIQQRILSHDPSLHNPHNHWLVRKSAAAAWTHGWFQFKLASGMRYRVVALHSIGGPGLPSIVDKMPAVRFSSFANRSAMDTPDVVLLQAVSRFAKPVRWIFVGRELAAKQLQPQRPLGLSVPSFSLLRLLSDHAAISFTAVWCLVPTAFRIQVYGCLQFLGVRLYGSSCSLKVQRLPFGLYLKTATAENYQALANEFGALQLVRRHTHIPVPRPLDLASDAQTSYLLTSRVPGLRLGACIDTLSVDQETTLVRDLQRYLRQLRAMSKEVAPQYAISNALGTPCFDYRLIAGLPYDKERGDFIGPFVDEQEFNETLQTPALPGVSHRSGHKIVFTHGDLNMRNVLICNGRLSGIVDWENSGWFPEYWDYTKAHFITKLKRRWLRIVDKVFKDFGDFDSDLATERQLWQHCYQ